MERIAYTRISRALPTALAVISEYGIEVKKTHGFAVAAEAKSTAGYIDARAEPDRNGVVGLKLLRKRHLQPYLFRYERALRAVHFYAAYIDAAEFGIRIRHIVEVCGVFGVFAISVGVKTENEFLYRFRARVRKNHFFCKIGFVEPFPYSHVQFVSRSAFTLHAPRVARARLQRYRAYAYEQRRQYDQYRFFHIPSAIFDAAGSADRTCPQIVPLFTFNLLQQIWAKVCTPAFFML